MKIKTNNAVLVSTFYPMMTLAGGSIGAYGMADSLRRLGYNVEACFVGKKAEYEKRKGKSDFIIHDCSHDTEGGNYAQMEKALTNLNPDIVWVHPVFDWEYFSPFALKYPHVLMAGDPKDRIERFRFKFGAGVTNNYLKKAVRWWRMNKLAKSIKAKEIACMREANANGIVTAYGPGDVSYRRKTTGIPVELCELAFPDKGARKTYTGKPNFLLLGNLTTVHTRYGLEYFVKKIWPLWKKSDLIKKSTIRIVGAGKMAKNIQLPPDQEGLKFVGFAESLEAEFENTIATLVAVPIDIGFRTRVIESWSKGIPVIMDNSSSEGLPNVQHNENCLVAENAAAFITQAQRILADNNLRQKIGDGGRNTFLTKYLSSNENVVNRYRRIVNLALK